MADSSIEITAGTGTAIDARTEATNGNYRQVIVIGDPATNAGVAPVDATKGLAVDLTATGANTTALKVDGSAVTQPVSAASLPLPTGAATAAKQPALGTAGTASADVISVQGIASGTALNTAPSSVVPGTGATNLGKAEDGAHTSGDVGVMALGVRNDTLATLAGTDLDYSPNATEISGRVLVSRSPAAAQVRGLASATDTTSTSVVAASGDAGLKTYITGVQVVNTGATAVLVTLQDGSGGTAKAYLIAPAGGGMVVSYETPLVTSANTALYFAAGGSTTTLYVTAQGYKAP